MALSSTSSLAPHLASKLPAAHFAALVCRVPSSMVSSRIGDVAQARSFSCQTGQTVLLNTDHRRKLMELWGHFKLDLDSHALRKNKEMKMLKWIERAEHMDNFEHMENFKTFMDIARKTFHKQPDGKGCQRAERQEVFNHFMDLVKDAIQNQTDSKNRADCKGRSRSSCQPRNGTTEEHASSSSAPTSSDLKITVYKQRQAASVTRIPGSTLKLAGKLTKACSSFQAHDVNLDEVMRLLETSTIQGKILEHEHLKEDVKVVISVGDISEESLGGIDQFAAPANLKIKTYKDGEAHPETITTVFGGILCDAGHVIPNSARQAMTKHGVDFEEVVRFSMDPHAKGVTILDHEDLVKKERVVISLE